MDCLQDFVKDILRLFLHESTDIWSSHSILQVKMIFWPDKKFLEYRTIIYPIFQIEFSCISSKTNQSIRALRKQSKHRYLKLDKFYRTNFHLYFDKYYISKVINLRGNGIYWLSGLFSIANQKQIHTAKIRKECFLVSKIQSHCVNLF